MNKELLGKCGFYCGAYPKRIVLCGRRTARGTNDMRYIKSCGFVAYKQIESRNYYLIIKSLNGDVGFPKGHMEIEERRLPPWLNHPYFFVSQEPFQRCNR